MTGRGLKRILMRMSAKKARGLDHWGPEELRALPVEMLGALACVMNKMECEGRWPEALRQVVVALNPKPKATHEGQLRPIGLLPMVYRLWMAFRRPEAKQWKAAVSGGTGQGAFFGT